MISFLDLHYSNHNREICHRDFLIDFLKGRFDSYYFLPTMILFIMGVSTNFKADLNNRGPHCRILIHHAIYKNDRESDRLTNRGQDSWEMCRCGKNTGTTYTFAFLNAFSCSDELLINLKNSGSFLRIRALYHFFSESKNSMSQLS